MFIGILDLKETKQFPGDLDAVRQICAFVVQAAEKAGLSASETYEVELAVDEACTNIIEHAYREVENGRIECTIEVLSYGLKIVLKDQGVRFNPEGVPVPDPKLPLKKVKPGGAGLYLMRKMMDEVKFNFSAAHGNSLTMVKRKSE